MNLDLVILVLDYFTYPNLHRLCLISNICQNKRLWLTKLELEAEELEPNATATDAQALYLSNLANLSYSNRQYLLDLRQQDLDLLEQNYNKTLEQLRQQHLRNIDLIYNYYGKLSRNFFTDQDLAIRDLAKIDRLGNLPKEVQSEISKLIVITNNNNTPLNIKNITSILDEHGYRPVSVTNYQIIALTQTGSDEEIGNLSNLLPNIRIEKYLDVL